MDCKDCQDKMITYLEGGLNEKEELAFEAHMQTCEDCKLALSQTSELIELMEQSTPVNPSVDSKQLFLEDLQREKATLKMSRSVPFLNLSVYRIAAAVALLIVGFGLGRMLPTTSEPSNQLAELQSEVYDMKQMVMMSMLKDESASERIQAVNFVEGFDEPSQEVIETLFRTLNEDESPNVRRAAIKALEKFSYDESVRLMLVRSFEFQKDPVVQITLIDLMVEIEEKRAAKKFQRLIDQEDTQKIVKQQAEIGLQLLI